MTRAPPPQPRDLPSLQRESAEKSGSFDAARRGYARARDLDPLRFRAPSVLNTVIREVAERQGAEVVDVHGAFVAASDQGLIGNDLMLEHVHPNLDGYFLLADAFYDALVARRMPAAPEVVVPDASAREEMPISDIDRWLGEYKALKVKSSWPFAVDRRGFVLPEAASEPERLAQEVFMQRISWPEAQDQLRRYDRAVGNSAGYAKITMILADAFPFSGPLQFESAAALIGQRRPLDALRYSRRGLEVEPRNVNLLLVTAHALLLTGRRAEVRPLLERVLALDPGNATATGVLRQLETEP